MLLFKRKILFNLCASDKGLLLMLLYFWLERNLRNCLSSVLVRFLILWSSDRHELAECKCAHVAEHCVSLGYKQTFMWT